MKTELNKQQQELLNRVSSDLEDFENLFISKAGSYNDNAMLLVGMVKDYCKGFAASVAETVLKYKRLSYKQRWVLAFALIEQEVVIWKRNNYYLNTDKYSMV